MITQFQVSPELQQFLQGIQSPRLVNVIWDASLNAADLPTLPTNPSSTRRSLIFDKGIFTTGATVTLEYNVFIQNTDGTNMTQVSTPRGV